MDQKYVTAAFEDDATSTGTDKPIYQYNYGQILRITGLNLPKICEIDFSLEEKGGQAKSMIGVTEDGVTLVAIPNSMLRNNDTDEDYKIFAFVYVVDPESGTTTNKIKMRVKARPLTEDHITPEDPHPFAGVIAAVSAMMEEAQRAEGSAEAWTHGKAEYPDRDQDNAAFYADQAKKASEQVEKEAEGIPGEVAKAKKEIDQYVQGKEEELKGETGNVYFTTFRVIKGRLIMLTVPEADKITFVRNGSRLAYRIAL